jgi:superfamily II DNA or RNA helicase
MKAAKQLLPATMDLETAKRLIDFSGGESGLAELGDLQCQGAVALYNMIADPEVGMGYLADEVGMGKTYIALGVVALMRYFNPMLRVLYICPSRNVQEKWLREYRNFIKTNVTVNQGRIRTREGRPAAPYENCRKVEDLVYLAGSGFIADFFIGKDAFSIGMSDDDATLREQLKKLKSLLPAYEWQGGRRTKNQVKEEYARALNYVLPTFDLVVIDEAHNFKHDFESSDRNRVLSRVLGFRGEEGYLPRAKKALLLSATPYDRDLTQLRNQLAMIGKSSLLPDTLDTTDRDSVKQQLRKFMVRRLNTLHINGEPHTRNMYRCEWRSGERAEIHLGTDEQKLVTALVQKKVGDVLGKDGVSPSFQMGMLASFESYGETAKSAPVEFDGDSNSRQQSDAMDREVIGQIVDSYTAAHLGRTLPHPKMDTVVERLSEQVFKRGAKQLVFVRRVKSVNELKNKLDESYNSWLIDHMNDTLAERPAEKALIGKVYDAYLEVSRVKDDDVSGGETPENAMVDDERVPPKNDTFFSWFIRGEPDSAVNRLLTAGDKAYQSPEAMRVGLGAKNQVNSLLLEPNWAQFVCAREGIDIEEVLERSGEAIAEHAQRLVTGQVTDDNQEMFQACQYAFLYYLEHETEINWLSPLLQHLFMAEVVKAAITIDRKRLREMLTFPSLYSVWAEIGLDDELSPYQSQLYSKIKRGEANNIDFKRFEIHRQLVQLLMRSGHSAVDFYLARLRQGPGNLTANTRQQWLVDFSRMLQRQSTKSGFSTWQELSHLAGNLDLLIKTNIPGILDLPFSEYRLYLSRAFNPQSPVIGANGETKGRSAQARKFRMPGYPLVLVSTDVFQEGEDLHTFCDSVMHYGLSGSPVSIEQKIGRVDRVNSAAQRRLISLNDRKPDDDELIQVTYPFVRESIEAIQVQVLCGRMNEFIESLNDIEPGTAPRDDQIDVKDHMFGSLEIPGQIRSYLKSPYSPDVDYPENPELTTRIEKNREYVEEKVANVSGLLKSKLAALREDQNVRLAELDEMDVVPGELQVKIVSAKSSGELLLSLTRHGNPSEVRFDSRAELLRLMKKVSWRTFHRTQAVACGRGIYELYFNSEMLIGDKEVTKTNDVDRLFERMDIDHDPSNYGPVVSEPVKRCLEAIGTNCEIEMDRGNTTEVTVEENAEGTSIVFSFDQHGVPRNHRVHLYEYEGRLIFLASASEPGLADRLTIEDIIRFTWERNRYVDIVEFMVDDRRAFVGRAVHPVATMHWREFIYCAYTLAVETDHLEYVLNRIDRY